jgi:hypothetical protein
MLVLLCVQVVQINNNESSYSGDKQKIHKLVKKAKKINYKNLVNKIYKLIVKELKLNVNCHI